MREDARVRYTKKIIRECFIRLLKKYPIEHITVSRICDDAEVNRATFYRYYDNPFDLLDKIETERLDGLMSRLEESDQTDFRSVFRIVMEDISENEELYSVLFSENGDKEFRDRIFTLCYAANMKAIERLFPEMDPVKREWLYYFVAEGSNGILKAWIRNGMKESQEETADFTADLIESLNRILPGII